MKNTFILTLLALLLLTSCGTQDVEQASSQQDETLVETIQEADMAETASDTDDISLETNQETDMAELTGNVVIDINHALAGKTLQFDVEMVNITKWGSGSTADTVESGDSVEVHYTGTLEDGEKFDSSRDRDQTLPFTVGAGQMIPGFDAGVVGMKVGESKTLTLAPADAYGEYDETKTQTIPKKDLASFVAAGISLEVGEKLPTQFGEFTIIEVTE